MTFAPELKQSVRDRTARVPFELSTGHSLEDVLSRHLLAVESMAQTVMLTSILLLDDSGKRLWHAAAPSLPLSYCEAINGAEIGPNAGSCGTAAFKGHAIYVTDIASDPLWSDYRHVALPHGLRACWSTPIRDVQGTLLGTFAVYHRTVRSPTRNEVEAINFISDHVARAIRCSRETQICEELLRRPTVALATLPIASNSNEVPTEEISARDILRSIETDFDTLVLTIDRAIEAFPDANPQGLRRARLAAQRGAELARRASCHNKR